MFRFAALSLLTIVSASAVADDNALITQALRTVAPSVKIQSITPSPMAGFSTVVAGGHVIYVSDDGKYLIEGRVYDVPARREIGSDSLNSVRKEALASIPPEKRLTFAPPNPKYHVAVFTDVDCPYCRQFHKEIAEYNRLGIAVDYLLFPLTIHPGADKKAQTVWCSKDRNTAYTSAMNGQTLPPKTCDNPISELNSIALTMGVDGTPAIFADDGTHLGSFMPPEQLVQRLDQMAQSGKKTAAAQ